MITNKPRYFILLILGLLLAISSSCNVQHDLGQITETVEILQTSTPVKTNVPDIANTPIKTPMRTPTILYTTDTPNPVVTMTNSDRELMVQTFIETTEDCRLPCFWKIVPGETYWNDLENQLRQMGIESIGSTPLESGNFYHSLGGFDLINRHVFNRFSFVERAGIVTNIHLISEGYANPEYFQEQWKEFSPSQVMSIYGKPSRVWLKTRAKTMGDQHGYGLWLVYDDYGFIIQYNGFLEENGQILHVCPRFEDGMDIMRLQIYIHAPDEITPLENMGGLVSPEPQAGKKSIEDATGLSVGDFYQLFQQNDQPACFDTPPDIWE